MLSPPATRTVLWVALVVAVVGLLLAAAASNWSSRTIGALSLVAALLAIVVPLVLDAVGPPREVPDANRARALAALHLCDKVREQWMAEGGRRGLIEKAPVRVKFTALRDVERDGTLAANPSDVLRHPGDGLDLPSAPPRLMDSGVVTELHELFQSLPRGRLVMVGEGGTGKTGALIRLLLRATKDLPEAPGNPVPILLAATDWDPAAHLTFASWVASETYRQHRYLRNQDTYGAGIVESLLSAGAMSAYLDGFDEMDQDRRPLALTQIFRETRFRIMLSSRPDQLKQASAEVPLAGAEVVELLTIPPEVGFEWLQHDQPEPVRRGWQEIADAAEDSGRVAVEALDKPLWLSLARSGYAYSPSRPSNDRLPTELMDASKYPTVAKIRELLLERTIADELRGSPYERTGRRHLEYLAQRMGDRTALTWWRVREWFPWVPIGVTSLAVGLGAMSIVGMYTSTRYAVTLGVSAWVSSAALGASLVHFVGRREGKQLTGSLPEVAAAVSLGVGAGTGLLLIRKVAEGSFGSPWIAAIGGAMLGAAAGIAIGLAATQDGPMLAVLRWPSLRDLRAGLGAAVALTITAMLAVEPAKALALGAIEGLGFAFAVGLTRPADTPGANMGPRESYDADIRGSLWFGVIGGAATAGGAAVVAPPGGMLGSPTASALFAGLVIGLAGMITASQALALRSCSVWLRLGGHGPAHLMRFLEFAHRRDLLRCAGAAFEFRHNELQRYLARGRLRDPSADPDPAARTVGAP